MRNLRGALGLMTHLSATYKAQALPSNGMAMMVESIICDGMWVDHNTTSPLMQFDSIMAQNGVTFAELQVLVQDLQYVVPIHNNYTGHCQHSLNGKLNYRIL